jgi:hypothetical protein
VLTILALLGSAFFYMSDWRKPKVSPRSTLLQFTAFFVTFVSDVATALLMLKYFFARSARTLRNCGPHRGKLFHHQMETKIFFQMPSAE